MTEKKKQFKALESALEFYDFHKDGKATYFGVYEDTKVIGNDKDGKPMSAHIFTDPETGEQVYIQSSYTINKSIDELKAKCTEDKTVIGDYVMMLQFVEKTMVKGKPFNRFKTAYMLVADYLQPEEVIEVVSEKKKK